jgi:hypothetical protein
MTRGRQSRVGNYGPMTRRPHRIKTHGPWQVAQPFAGIYVGRAWSVPPGRPHRYPPDQPAHHHQHGPAGDECRLETYTADLLLDLAA